jgi:hypothetical protein
MKDFRHSIVDPPTGRVMEAIVTHAGEDIIIVVTGGTRPHLGSVVLAQPVVSPGSSDGLEISCSVITIPPHKEEVVARPIAEAVCAVSRQVALVTAGIHEDGLDGEGIDTYLKLADRMAEELASRFQ